MVALAETALRASQFLWTLLILALVGNAIATAFAGNPSSVNFAMFVAALSAVAVLYGLAAAFIESLVIPIVMMVMDGILVVFTFIAGTLLAAKLGVHSCGNQSYLHSNNLTNGSHNMGKRCHELQASTAFFWFLFASYVGSLVLDFLGGRGGMSSRGGGMRRGGPSMSQV